MSLQGAPPPPATDTQSGLLSHLAQLIGGVKTFVGLIVASAGVQVASLFNTNGTGAADVVVKVGTSQPYASANATAKIVQFVYGLGGTETEQVALTKNGLYFNGYPSSAISCSGSWLQLGVLPVRSDSYFFSVLSGGTAFYASNNSAFGAPATAKIWSENAAGATDVAAKIGCYTADASVNAGTKLVSLRTGMGGTESEKLSVVKDGTIEIYTNGAGIVLRSPDGNRWRITVANGGTLTIAAA